MQPKSRMGTGESPFDTGLVFEHVRQNVTADIGIGHFEQKGISNRSGGRFGAGRQLDLLRRIEGFGQARAAGQNRRAGERE